MGYCDGTKYPDGSYWHHIQYGMPWVTDTGGPGSPLTSCVIDNGGPVPAPAPPGGCGGAVK
ncbi:MAG: hypothetical protein ACRDTV_08000 [Mycobacterium sp.]